MGPYLVVRVMIWKPLVGGWAGGNEPTVDEGEARGEADPVAVPVAVGFGVEDGEGEPLADGLALPLALGSAGLVGAGCQVQDGGPAAGVGDVLSAVTIQMVAPT